MEFVGPPGRYRIGIGRAELPWRFLSIRFRFRFRFRSRLQLWLRERDLITAIGFGSHVFPGIVQDTLEELLVFGGKLVVLFPVFPLRERSVGIEIAPDVASSALDEVGGQTAAVPLVFGAGQILGKGGEVRVQECQERAERLLVAAVGSGGHQDHVAVRVCGETLDQLVALMAAAPARPTKRRCGLRRRSPARGRRAGSRRGGGRT